mgnify:CR=1 FL=1
MFACKEIPQIDLKCLIWKCFNSVWCYLFTVGISCQKVARLIFEFGRLLYTYVQCTNYKKPLEHNLLYSTVIEYSV